MFGLPVVPAATALALASVLGCAGSGSAERAPVTYQVPTGPPVALAVDHVFYIPGEQLEWEISLRGIVGGEASMAMGQPGNLDGKHALIIKSQVRSAGMLKLVKDVRDDVTSWIDLESGQPIKHTADLKFGNKEVKVATEFKDDAYRIDFERIGRARYQRTIPLAGAIAHDGHSIIGVLRAWEPKDGSRAYFYVLSGRRLWRNDITFVGREVLKTTLGTTPTVRIDGTAVRLNSRMVVDSRRKPRVYTVWITDDANRIPVRVTAKTEYGDVIVNLVRYDRPERRIVWR